MTDESIIDAIGKLIEPRRQDQEFMQRLRDRIEQDAPILERLKAAERIDRIPSHKSPPDDGITYTQIDRLNYRVKVGDYTGLEIRRFAAPPITLQRDLWLLVPGEDDHLIRDDDTVAIRNSGLRFFTTPRFINAG